MPKSSPPESVYDHDCGVPWWWPLALPGSVACGTPEAGVRLGWGLL